MGISIWLVPPPDVTLALEKIMRAAVDNSIVKEEDDASKSYPTFQPHVTLVGSLPSPIPFGTIYSVLGATRSPVEVTFERVKIGDHYYRSVFIAMQLSEDLLDLHGRMHLNLEIQPRTPAYPHMSLSYINDDDASTGERQRCYDRLKSEFPHLGRVSEDDSVEINVASEPEEESEWRSRFLCSEAWVVDCNGPVEGWTVLEKIPLGQ